METETTQLREYWLRRAAVFLLDHMQRCGLKNVAVRVSCGWPSSGGLGVVKMTVGECFSPKICADGIPQIFVPPRIAESVEVLAILLHELIHASVGNQYGYRKEFSQAVRATGLEGPPTATVVGDKLRPLFVEYITQVGAYPHAAIRPVPKEKKGSRLRLYKCLCEPPMKVRIANDDFIALCLRCNNTFQKQE